MDLPIGLLADVGRNSVRFALAGGEEGPLPRNIISFQTSEHPTFTDALLTYIRRMGLSHRALPSAFAIAGTIHGSSVNLTGSRWYVSLSGVEAVLRREPIALNECAAAALALTRLPAGSFTPVRGPAGHAPRPGGCYLVIAPGTGLGIAVLVTAGNSLVAIQSEAAHMRYSGYVLDDPRIDAFLSRSGLARTNEALLSADGLLNLYRALGGSKLQRPEQITEAARGEDALAVAAVRCFTSVLSRMVDELILAFGAWDGVYLAGPVIRAIRAHLTSQSFQSPAARQGAFRSKIAEVPISVVDRADLELLGASVALGGRPG